MVPVKAKPKLEPLKAVNVWVRSRITTSKRGEDVSASLQPVC